MQPILTLQLLLLLMLANGTPLVAKKLLGERYSYPLDCNLKFSDGRPLLGRSKTVRGVLLAVLVTTAGASITGLGWKNGVLIGGFAMAGDLVSSFSKRRLNRPSSSRASGLDQVPESLFPLLACRNSLSLGIGDIAVCVAVFFAGDVLLSRLLYAWHLRDRPY
jgi:CDP-archaeol synthase